MSFWCFYWYFTPFSYVSVVDFEQLNLTGKPPFYAYFWCRLIFLYKVRGKILDVFWVFLNFILKTRWTKLFTWDIGSRYRVTIRIPTNDYLFKVSHRNTRKRSEISSELTLKAPEWRHWRRFGVFIVNFEHISQVFRRILIVNFEQLNVYWIISLLF